MKIATCAPQVPPMPSPGGLGDVMEALPAALSRIEGNEVALFLPYYYKIKTNTAYQVEKVAEFRVKLGWRQQYCGVMKLLNRKDGVQVYFLDSEYYFGARTGAIYGDMDDGDASPSSPGLHGWPWRRWNTFPTHPVQRLANGPVPVYLKAVYRAQFPGTRIMYTIHNIEYQGWANAGFFDDMLGLPWEFRGTLDMNHSVNMMKGGIECCDMLTTVSETYARELMYPTTPTAWINIITGAAWKLTGITNGIDVNTFNPETDPRCRLTTMPTPSWKARQR